MEDALAEIARQAPYLAALIVLIIGYGALLWKFIQAANARMDMTEIRHTQDRQAQEDRWMSRVHNISIDCHAAQDRASEAIEKMAISSTAQAASNALMATSMSALDSKLDTVIQIARSSA